MSQPRRGVIFLAGDTDESRSAFYRESASRPNTFVVFADGGARINAPVENALLVGDFDSLDQTQFERLKARGVHVDERFAGMTDKDETDGQLALRAALDAGCVEIDIHGAFPRPGVRDHDHFLGNLSLLIEARPQAIARVSEPYEAIHLCNGSLELRRQGDGLNRVSVVPVAGDARIRRSEGLRWPLNDFTVTALRANALRNEFLSNANVTRIELASDSPPVYVFHNWE